MKKILSLIGKALLGLIALVLILYLGFRIKEYFAGIKYVDYLENHTLVKNPIGEPLIVEFDDEFYKHNLFLLGEFHEFATSPIIDVAMFKHLHEKINADIYLAEMDIAQSYFLNEYLKQSTKLSLDRILESWVVNIGKISKNYRNGKWENFKKYYTNLSADKKFQVIGVDAIRDYKLLQILLSEKLPDQNKIPEDEDELIKWGIFNIPKILSEHNFAKEDEQLLNDIVFNLENSEKSNTRDEFMFRQFKYYYHQKNWSTKNLYGSFGLYHTLQGFENTFAGRINRSEHTNSVKMVSVNPIYLNSHLTVKSSYLPWFISDNAEYTRLSISQDNMFDNYIIGIEDFKRVGNKNSINLFKLNAQNSPYQKSLRGISNFSLTPFFGINIKNKNTVTTDYFQYVFVIDGSDWVSPK